MTITISRTVEAGDKRVTTALDIQTVEGDPVITTGTIRELLQLLSQTESEP